MDNPSAFPVNPANLGGYDACEPEPGMSLRDWFAGRVVTGVIANSENVTAGADPTNIALSCRPDEFADWLAKVSYFVADAMLRERAKSTDLDPIDTSVGGVE
ncbi:hypothetical protein [Sphingobium abikonense]|uniref:hypothetical protein n=1 Tax=Sphingobium abikonense TaxID=86193 RepID=UPI0035171EF8